MTIQEVLDDNRFISFADHLLLGKSGHGYIVTYLPARDAVWHQKEYARRCGPEYKSDVDALLDFIAINRAKIEEEKDEDKSREQTAN